MVWFLGRRISVPPRPHRGTGPPSLSESHGPAVIARDENVPSDDLKRGVPAWPFDNAHDGDDEPSSQDEPPMARADTPVTARQIMFR